MIDEIKQRLERYDLSTGTFKDQAIREIVQEIAIHGLSQSNFFDKALFNGGTSLRILYNIPRFSEDLDFMLRQTDPDFPWERYITILQEVFTSYGILCEIQLKGNMSDRVRKAMLKDNSVTKELNLSFKNRDPGQKIKIKLEIDLYPPENFTVAETNLDFPSRHLVRHLDLPSNFAQKIHAMLCRRYTKGRDWYDFVWYVNQGVKPNVPHLQSALIQNGPWQGQKDLVIDREWIRHSIYRTIEEIDWNTASNDISNFVHPDEKLTLDNWGKNFFFLNLQSLIGYMD